MQSLYNLSHFSPKTCQRWKGDQIEINLNRKKKGASLRLNASGALPSEAEGERGHAKDGGHSVPGQGGGPAGTEVETEPEASGQSQQLTCHKIHL